MISAKYPLLFLLIVVAIIVYSNRTGIFNGDNSVKVYVPQDRLETFDKKAIETH